VELYAAVRRAVFVEGVSERTAARRFGIARKSVRKMVRFAVPPGYTRNQPVRVSLYAQAWQLAQHGGDRAKCIEPAVPRPADRLGRSAPA
jgi:hypothetical protein